MVLSDRFGGKRPPQGLLVRTLAYVLGFGLGALLIAVVLGVVSVAIAESVLPNAKDRAASTAKAKQSDAPEAEGDAPEPVASTAPARKRPLGGLRPSKARPSRGTPPSPAVRSDTEEEL